MAEKKEKDIQDLGLTVKKNEDFSEWYTQLIKKAELADYSSVSGCIVFRPNSYSIWEKIQSYVDKKIKALGHKNVYFPLLIPEKLLTKEQEHVKGFTPEVAWVTHAGETELDERLAIRPTSETIMYESYSKWIRSHRDLPLLLNQWCNVVRWEFKHAKPFLRTREFLWQEGHTAHATKEDADREVMTILELYRDLIENVLAIPVLTGKKTESEKFAGALYTTTLEALMPDKKALQAGTSHHLGQNFAKAFDIKFIDEDEQTKHVWQTSWGISTRLIGGLIMVHSDDKGLVMPPQIAPTHVVIVPIIFDKTKKETIEKSKELKAALEIEGHTVILDDREEHKAGFKYNEWELKGIPIRIELGPRDMEKGQVVLVRRDTGAKSFIKEKDLVAETKKALDAMQKDMFSKAKAFLEKSIFKAKDMAEFKKNIENGFILAGWCESPGCEEKIKEETGATARLIPFDSNSKSKLESKATCVCCKKPAKHMVYFARAY
ncbi:MAG: proline--tRNA ligase [archaeon]